MFDAYFSSSLKPDPLLWAQHDPWLVALSLLVSMGAAGVALHLANLAREAGTPGRRQVALGTGALALGSGIWTMHYIGMLAFALCGQAGFDPWLTLLSVLPGLAAAWVALRLLQRETLSARVLWASALAVGAGIGAMHYIGMAASELAPYMRYDLFGFVLSVLVAVLLAALALWVRFGLRGRLGLRTGRLTMLAGAVMGLAIAGMHYTGMAALRFVEPIAQINVPTATVPLQVTLSLAIAIVTLALTGLVVALNASLRYRQLYQQVQASEERQRAIVDTASDAVVMVDGEGRVRTFNPSAERMFGWSAREIIGQPFGLLAPDAERALHEANLRALLHGSPAQGRPMDRDVHARRRDASVFPARLAFGRVQTAGELLAVGFVTDLTARQAAEEALRRSEEQLRGFVGNLPGVAFRLLTGEPRATVFISEVVQALTGWSADDFLQGRVQLESLVHPDDRARREDQVRHSLALDAPWQLSYRIVARDGQTRWASEYARGARDVDGRLRWIDGVLLDVSEERARSAEFRGTVTAMNRAQALAEFSPDGHLIQANDNYLALTGYTLDEVLGLPHSAFCPPEFAAEPAYAAFWQRLRAGEFIVGEFERRGKDGRPLWIHASYNPIFDAEGKVFKIVKFVTDLSQRRAMEQDLRAAKERAEQAAAARSAFLANMSHEIRTPMNAIIGFTEALLDTPLTEAQRRPLSTVQRSARSLLRLLNDILDSAKLERGAVQLELRAFDLRALCEDTLATLQAEADRKGLALCLDFPPEVGAAWQGDAFRLQQILINLLGNAIKFTHQGSVTLRAVPQTQGVQLDVVDTGIGMSADAAARIFDAFTQADASTTRRYGGTGLGTSIARQLAELMQGEITLRSAPGEGSTFSLRLPLHAARPEEVAAAQAPARTAAPLPPLAVLAVDDVHENLEVLEAVLARDGHAVTTANSGAQALELLARQRFDLVLMDLQMPDMDGLEATRRLRAREAGGTRLPVIALSASVLEQDRRDALAAGMDGFADKPLDPPRLIAEIARVLGLAPPAAAEAPLAPTPTLQPAPVDWASGIARWGTRVALDAALRTFVRQQADLPGRLQALHGDWPALAAEAHRLRGVAGNLALVRLQAVLAALEQAARQGDIGAAQAALVLLPDAWHALAPLGRTDETDAPEDASHTAHAAPDAAARDRALQAIASADALLEHGELPEQALAALAACMDAPGRAALQDALDGFDFAQARSQLQQLRTQLEEAQP